MTACVDGVANHRHPSPSEAVVDHCVKSAAMVSKTVGFDAGKLVKGRKRFLTVDTLGCAAVWVTAASVGGARREATYSKVKQMGEAVSRLHLVWWMAALIAHSCGG